MGVLQNIGDRMRTFIYERAQTFIKNEDVRKEQIRREKFEEGFFKFKAERNPDSIGYEDFDSRVVFKVYNKYGEKGLDLIGFNDGVKLKSMDIFNLLHLVERCEFIEIGKPVDAGIDLALRLVNEFSLEEVVRTIDKFQEPYLVYAINSRYDLEQLDKERGQRDLNEEIGPEEDISDVEVTEEYEQEFDSYEDEQQIADVDELIAGASVRSKATEINNSMSFEKDYVMD